MVGDLKLHALDPAGLIQPAGAVFQRVDIDAELIGQDAAHPNRQGHPIFGHADNAALQILGRLYA